MYPMNASSGEYMFGSPMVDEAVIALPNNKQFVIEVQKQSAGSKYISSAVLNGIKIPVSFISHKQIVAGGKLQLRLSDTP